MGEKPEKWEKNIGQLMYQIKALSKEETMLKIMKDLISLAVRKLKKTKTLLTCFIFSLWPNL